MSRSTLIASGSPIQQQSVDGHRILFPSESRQLMHVAAAARRMVGFHGGSAPALQSPTPTQLASTDAADLPPHRHTASVQLDSPHHLTHQHELLSHAHTRLQTTKASLCPWSAQLDADRRRASAPMWRAKSLLSHSLSWLRRNLAQVRPQGAAKVKERRCAFAIQWQRFVHTQM